MNSREKLIKIISELISNTELLKDLMEKEKVLGRYKQEQNQLNSILDKYSEKELLDLEKNISSILNKQKQRVLEFEILRKDFNKSKKVSDSILFLNNKDKYLSSHEGDISKEKVKIYNESEINELLDKSKK